VLRAWRATVNSWNGLTFAIRSEQAIREELAALLLSVPLAWLIGTTPARRIELVAVILLLLVVELLNTAIEKLADRLTWITIRRSGASRTSGPPPSASRW